MDSKIRARLSAFAERLSGPLGNVPLDRAIRTDLGLFQILRDSGATWPQIANALASAGARRPNGSIIPADHVRSAVSRQLTRSDTKEPRTFRPQPSEEQPPLRELSRAAPSTVSEHHIPKEQPGASKTSNSSHVNNSPEGNTEQPSKRRNQSILAKLARTRKLRES